MPLPKPTAIGRLPVIAVIGAAVATAMNTTPTSPTEFALRRCTSRVGFSVIPAPHVVLAQRNPKVKRRFLYGCDSVPGQ
ncbi:hypothetical protein ACFQ3Z_12030 [Streptomyces nogalater]